MVDANFNVRPPGPGQARLGSLTRFYVNFVQICLFQLPFLRATHRVIIAVRHRIDINVR